MALFFTRRTYNARLKRFTNNVSDVTRHVKLALRPGGRFEGGIISEADWLDQVAQAAGGNGVVIYVHGFNTDQHSMLVRCGLIETGLAAAGVRGAVVAFDWPSQGVVTAYNPDLAAAKAVAPFLVPDGVRPLIARLGGQPIHMLCHSMGCYVTLRALRGVGEVPGAPSVHLDQVIFAAGDVEAEQLRRGAGGALVMQHRCNRMTNFYSVADRVLQFSGVLNGGRQRAGFVGLPDPKGENAVDVYTTAQFRRDVPGTDQDDYVLSHNWYYANAGFYRDVALTLAGTPDAQMPTRRATNISDRALLS